MSLAIESVPYGPGSLSANGALADKDLLEQLRRYKRIIAKRYRVIPSDKAERVLPEGELRVSTKLDGQLWFLVARHGAVALCSYNGRVLEGIPLVTELGAALGDFSGIIAGELYAVGAEGRPRVQHVTHALGAGERHDRLRFKAFDLVEDGTQDGLALHYTARLTRLQEVLGEDGVVQTEVVDRDGVPKLYRDWVLSEQHEGLIARSEQGSTYKIKQSISLDLVVVAFGARITGETRQLREMTVALVNDEGQFQIVGTVGTGFSDEDRMTWHHRLSGLAMPSSYRMASSEGTLATFVKPEIVVEVKCTDLLTLDSTDHAIRRMRLAYDPDQGYTPLGEYPTAVLLHPRFERERDDKAVDQASVGMDQIFSRVSLEDAAKREPVVLPEAEIIDRKVFVKITKDKKAVRKYVAIKTNKSPEDGYSAYALFTTDFSAGRAEPLKTSIQVAADKGVIDGQIATWLEENVKRGWNEVES